MEDRQIVWDDEKEAVNLAKHHLSFKTAKFVFSDPQRVERLDRSEGNTSGETRWQTMGDVDGIIFLVYMEREDETRLIMARRASKAERKSYYGYYQIDGKGWTKAN
jgi:uncharacterized DUF497 family protein